uniref:Uncharacterized protein n=1 Tax=Rhinopithecus roxellana TaxID=61622 RepID=A0A2K6RG28_RHIRO
MTSPAAACLALHFLHILLRLLFFRRRRRRCVEARELKFAARRAGEEKEAREPGIAGRPEARGRRRAEAGSPPQARRRHCRPPGLLASAAEAGRE